jgi:15-cis-phytoene synthase
MELDEHIATQAAYTLVEIQSSIASKEDYATCREIMRRASRRYAFASNFLPADKLKHVEALYALLRVGDDRVDVSHAGFESPKAAIDDWERTYWRAIETGDSPNPVMRAYLNTAIECGIPQGTMVTYFRAMRDDLTITRFPTFEHLMNYMEGSAILVGRAMTHILGVREQYTMNDAIPRADSLSVAMQLSNFLRDIGQDLTIGRIYLPQEDLERFGITESNLRKGIVNHRFVDLMEYEIARTEQFYDQAYPGVQMLASGRWGVMSGLEIYRVILSDIRRIDYDVFNRCAEINLLHRINLAVKSWWRTELSQSR